MVDQNSEKAAEVRAAVLSAWNINAAEDLKAGSLRYQLAFNSKAIAAFDKAVAGEGTPQDVVDALLWREH